MARKFVIKPKLHGSGFSKAGNTGLKSWQAINELIANSVDSWIMSEQHKKSDLIVKVELDNRTNDLKNSSLRIVDNSLGMSEKDLEKLVNHYESDKPNHKYGKILLGLYGFGFKGSTGNLGRKITVITTDNTKEYYKFSIVHSELDEMGLEPEINAEAFDHESTTKKLFNGSPTGTIIQIEDFRRSIPPAILYDWLPVSWQKFMTGDVLDLDGKPISKRLKLYVGSELTKENLILPYSTEAHKDTLTPINLKFEWFEGKNKFKGVAEGFFGFRFKNASMVTQGINIYRNGQLIERYNHSLYMGKADKHNDHNSLVGELNVNVAVNTVKTTLEDSEAEKALKEAFYKEFQPYKPTVRLMSIAVSKDKEHIDLAIANYRKEFNMTLSSSQKSILNSKGSLIDSSTETNKSNKSGTKTSKSVPKNKLNINFKMIDWNQFSLEGKNYTVEFNPFDGNPDNVPYTITSPTGNSLPIYVYIKHPNGAIIMDAQSKQSKNRSDKFLLQLIVYEAIEAFLNRLNFKKKDILGVKEIVLER